MSADVIKASEGLRCCGESRYSISGNKEVIFNRKIRNIKVWTTEEKMDETSMPSLNEKVPDNWTELYTGPAYDFMIVFYPFFSRDFMITKQINWDSDFAIGSLCEAKGVCNYIKALDVAKKMEGLENCDLIKLMKLRAFRCMLVEDEKKKWNASNTPVVIDGDIFSGTISQGFLVNDFTRQMA